MPLLHSFRARLLTLLLIGVLPALAIVIYMNLEQRRLEASRVRERVLATSVLSAANEQNYFTHTRQMLATLAQFSFLTLTTNREVAHQHLANLRKLSPDYLNFGLIESSGLLFCSSEPSIGSINLGDRSYFRRVLQTRHFAAGDFQIGRLTSEPGLNFGWPIFDDAGRLDRVLFASLKIPVLSQALARIPLLPEESITVLDRNGTILARTPQPETWTGKTWANTAAFQRILQVQNGAFDLKGSDGVRRLHAVTTVHDSDTASLFVTVDIPVKVCYQRANSNLARNLAFLILAAAVILFAGRYYANRYFLKPVASLARAAVELATGNLGARVAPIAGPPELARLGAAFDQMAARLGQRDAEVRAAQTEIQKMNTELERRVTDRTAELQAANQELEAFSYSVSHDLRAPLRHISGFVDILQRREPPLDEESRRIAAFIAQAGRQMNQLIDDLLQFSRITRAELRLTKVDLSKVVAEVRAGLEPELNGRAIDWLVKPLPSVKGDTALLRVVLTNLLENAIKYTRPRDPARIEIGAQSDGSESVMYVRDNGVGFDMQYAKKLFGVFQRFHDAEQFDGSGIGLATAHRIISRLGGRIWAESRPDAGATFFFSLPPAAEDQINC